MFAAGATARCEMLLFFEHRIEIFPQTDRRLGRGHGVERSGSLVERGELTLAFRAIGQMAARVLELPIMLHRTWAGVRSSIEQFGECFTGALAIHGGKGAGVTSGGEIAKMIGAFPK